MIECCVCGIRNLCINSLEHQEDVARCNGMVPLLQLLHPNTKSRLLEYVSSAIAKACSLSDNNRRFVKMQYGNQGLEALLKHEHIDQKTKQHVRALLEYTASVF